jgi:phospholipid-binding lipoprotein MlaA
MKPNFACGAGLRRLVGMWLLLGVFALAGCATGPHANPKDPIEPFNRGVQRFNDGVDEAFLKPVATVYRDVTPDLVRTGVNNFFSNLRDLWSSVNAALQLRPREATENFLRFSVNTFWGIGGLLDIASEMQIERTTLDFGQTLGRWGVPPGPYLVLPLMGPSTLRDAVGMGVESSGDLLSGMDHIPSRNTLYAWRVIEARANLLRAGSLLDQAALDKYSFTRDAFLQRRESQIRALTGKNDDADEE